MTSCEEKIIQIPGFSLGVKIWNPKALKPVLCLHGKLDNAASFDLLAPVLPNFQLVAVDFPGTGLSSAYPNGVIPYWKNDAFLILALTKAMGWQQFDIIGHSLGSLIATILAIGRPQQVRKLVFLDVLGPTVNFIEQAVKNLQANMDTYLNYKLNSKTIFANRETAIKYRMQFGNISYQAAAALFSRGAKETNKGWIWTFDPRLHYVSSTVPYEDEIRSMFKAIQISVCLIRASQGINYPEDVFQARASSIKDLTISEVQGGHHVHMDDPIPVAKIITQFLGTKSDV